MSQLFSPVQFGNVELSNRVIVSPMCQYSANAGKVTDWHTVHLGGLALSGAGLLILEATGVEPEGRITPYCVGLYNDATEHALANLMQLIRGLSPIKLGIQLGHAGRKGSSARPWEGGHLLTPDEPLAWERIAPSALSHNEGELPPRAMSIYDIESLIQSFVESAKRAVRLGFDVIELHGAHGYLLHQFLSPIANHRKDQYGGSLTNRMRLLLEIFSAVKAVVPSHIALGVRISACDWMEQQDSWTLEQSIVLCDELEKLGCHFVDVSSGGVSPHQKIAVGPGYQVPFAQAIKAQAKMPVISVGMITSAQQAESIVKEQQADAVAIARAFLYDPRWAWHAAAELGASVYGPPQYWRGLPAVSINSGANKLFSNMQIK